MGSKIESCKFCKLSSKIVEEESKTFVELVRKPKFVCMKCFRTSSSKKNLCKPQKLKGLALK
ncbi:hypothetical protein CSA56_00350 [candidate division KSB3 bacterium]|uniref:Uncharacterized protein n=1 Tax=candidate division KSB3 bacterium TaxID=2044937 RepID=A0A2G6KLC9_9BACT|nr:MAG: hypothetical protein CSA56_00350 [candidate division KSB3 bacterium]